MKSDRHRFQRDASIVINKTRSIYTDWARKNQVSYYELMILGMLYKGEDFTQNQISEACGLPKQTVNRIVGALAKAGHLVLLQTGENRKAKRLRLTKEGEDYAFRLLLPFWELERLVSKRMGEEGYRNFISLAQVYQRFLENEMTAAEGDRE